MSAIALNTQYVSLISTEKIKTPSNGFDGSFSITSTLEEIGIRENDHVVIITPLNKKDLRFESEGVIKKVGDVMKVPKDLRKNPDTSTQTSSKDSFKHSFSLEIIKDIKSNNLLSDLEYSLKAVYRFNNPIIHFQQQFRDLTKQDYETIVSGFIYQSRTAFGKLVNAIPRQNKLEFMLQAMDHFSTVDFKEVSLYNGLDFLYEYINKRILSRGKLLIETNNLLKNSLSDIVPFEEIGFFDPAKDKYDNLSKQALLFEELFKLEKESDVRKIIKKTISEDAQLEYRFMQIFKSETWPIDLTI